MSNTETGITVIEQSVDASVVEWNLDSFPEAEFNRLLPTQTIQMPTDLLRPVVQVVKLSPNPADGDVYHSDDMAADHSAPTKVGLRKLSTAAGISIVDEKRTDDGTDPDVIEVTALAEMLLPTGVRIQAMGMKRIDLNAKKWSAKNPDVHRAKFKAFFLENVASGAENRAIRALASLRSSYPTQAFNRPFAVVSYAPNMNHPEIRARYLDALAPAAAQLFGGTAAPKQVGPGPGVVKAPPAPEEDPAPRTPTQLPGETLAKASTPEEPEWMRDSSPAPKGAAKAKPSDMPTMIRDTAAAAADPDALATDAERSVLKDLFAGWDTTLIGKGIIALWPEEDDEGKVIALSRLTAGQAAAIATVHDTLGHEAFEREWRNLAEKAAVAA